MFFLYKNNLKLKYLWNAYLGCKSGSHIKSLNSEFHRKNRNEGQFGPTIRAHILFLFGILLINTLGFIAKFTVSGG